MEPYELRWMDVALSEESTAIARTVRDFLSKQCPPERVRASEPLGFDRDLWRQLVDIGVVTMTLAETVGGGGGTLVDLALVAEEVGRSAAPVPFLSQVVCARILARTDIDPNVLSDVLSGQCIVALAPKPVGARPQLVPDAAVAQHVVALHERALVLFSLDEPPAHVANQGSTPLAWWHPGSGLRARTVLCDGSAARHAFDRAVRERTLLTAAALVGLTQSALRTAVDFARTRKTRGVPIGTLQGISFSLANVQIGLASARNLVRRAAWAADFDQPSFDVLAHTTLPYALRVATEGTAIAAHTQGGLGFTREAEISLYFLRAKSWGLLGGDPAEDRAAVAEALRARATAAPVHHHPRSR